MSRVCMFAFCNSPTSFGAKPPGLFSGRQMRFGLRARREATTNGEDEVEKTVKKKESGFDILSDDGFGNVTANDYFTAAQTMMNGDGGPPRWFCPVECKQPKVAKAPLLMFLPGTDGVGMELIFNHQSLGRVFEVRSLHIPVQDRTPFKGLLEIVEASIKYEHFTQAKRPIYIIGDSFGGCLATSVAARNPEIDLILILVNPETSFHQNPLHFPPFEKVPSILRGTGSHLLRTGGNTGPDTQDVLSDSLSAMQHLFSDTLLWKLKLLKSGAAYANSCLHDVKAEVLLLSRYSLLPCGDDADRLLKTLRYCKVRYFRNFTDRLLLDNGINILTVIKGANMYRRGVQRDYVIDYLPPTISEFEKIFEEEYKLFRLALSPVVLSTLKNGRIVRGLIGIPDRGPVLFVGSHALLAIDLFPLYEQFLREKKTILRTMAHPLFFEGNVSSLVKEMSVLDNIAICGGVPVTAFNLYKLLERNELVLLYPGGIREALHRKGEEYRLFWPDQAEFVRMAVLFGATIVPFGCVGEDDFLEIILDYNDQRNLPYFREWIEALNQGFSGVRDTVKGEDGNQVFHLPAVLPKLPGRLYYLFGKPIEMGKMRNVLRDKQSAKEAYMNIKSEVENMMSYLKRKRDEDPYRGIGQRALYQSIWGVSAQIPTFEL